MITQMLLDIVYALVSVLVALIPDTGFTLPSWALTFADFISIGLSFFPPFVFIIIIANINFWLVLHMAWAIIEWAYHKVPGIT